MRIDSARRLHDSPFLHSVAAGNISFFFFGVRVKPFNNFGLHVIGVNVLGRLGGHR